MNYRLKIALGCILAVSGATTSYGANLLDVYQRAQQSDPQIREADATRLASRENKPQALSALLPQLNASGGWSKATTESKGLGIAPNPNNPADPFTYGVIPTVQHTPTKNYQVQLTQTLFRWDQWVTLRSADSQVAQAEADYLTAQQNLVLRVAQAYFNVLAAQDAVDAANAANEAFAQQFEQAQKRFEVGLIAITDVQEAKAARDQATATVIATKRILSTNHELLREITGEDYEHLAAPTADMPLTNPQPDSIDKWVSTAMEQNASLISARLAENIAKNAVSVAEAGHLPTLDLVASRGQTYQGDQTTTYPGQIDSASPYDSRQTQVGLQLKFPIFSGGSVASRVRQQVYLHRAARERLEHASRDTQRSTRDNYLGVISNISRVGALKQALESQNTALQATTAGYEVGTRTAIEVLDSRRQVFTAQTNYSQSRYDYILSVIQLKLAAGTLSQNDVVEINSWLK
jgi:outer membrane protein